MQAVLQAVRERLAAAYYSLPQRGRGLVLAGLVIVAAVVFMAVAAPVLAPYSPVERRAKRRSTMRLTSPTKHANTITTPCIAG